MLRLIQTIFVRHNGRVERVSCMKASHEHERSRPRLLRLPTELRPQISEYVLETRRTYDFLIVRPPVLALVNRRLFREVSSMFLGNSRFRVQVHFNCIPVPIKTVYGLRETLCNSEGSSEPWFSHSSEVRFAPLCSDSNLQDHPDAENLRHLTTLIWPHDSASNAETETITTDVSSPTKLCVDIPEWMQRPCFDPTKATTGKQAWLRVLRGFVKIRHVVFEVYIDSTSDPKLVVDTNLDAKLMCFSIVTMPTIEAHDQRDWPCPDNTDRKAEQKETAFEGVKQRLGPFADEVICRGRAPGFTLTDIEDMMDAFDVVSNSD